MAFLGCRYLAANFYFHERISVWQFNLLLMSYFPTKHICISGEHYKILSKENCRYKPSIKAVTYCNDGARISD